MTTYAVTYEVPESKRWYITPGKHYEVLNDYMGFFDAILDDGSKSYLTWDRCAHLDGYDWLRVESASYHFWGIHDDEVV